MAPVPRRLALRAAVGAAMTGAAWPRLALAQEWPSRPVRIVAPFTPGGTADIIGRALAQQLGEQTRQNFVLENRAGAGGAIGSDMVAKAPPDGATLVISGIASHVVAPVVSKTPYHPVDSFTHIALLGGPPSVLVVHPDLAARNVREFVALANAAAQGLSWGSSGTGTHAHLIGELFRDAAKAKLVHISYKGGAPVMTDVIGRQIPAAFTALSSAFAHIRAGRVRALATTAAQRAADLPDVPTFAEAGFAQLTAVTWFSLSGPAGMPPALAAQINTEVRRALAAPKVRERLQTEGIEPGDLDVAAFNRFLRTEIERWTPIARAAKTDA